MTIPGLKKTNTSVEENSMGPQRRAMDVAGTLLLASSLARSFDCDVIEFTFNYLPLGFDAPKGKSNSTGGSCSRVASRL